jgi:hypothetical protein
MPDADRNTKSPPAPLLEYASIEARIPRVVTIADMLYFALAIACWLLAGYAQSIMPGGPNWDFDWEYANFLMTIAALSSFVLFVAGLFAIFRIGWKRVAIIVLLGLLMTSILPIVMSLFAKRWLQNNFA